MNPNESNISFFWVALLIILWWVGVWGFVDTLLHLFIKGSPQTALLVYGTLAVVVGIILYQSPQLREYFL
jgi:hypothetical protein